MAYQQANRVLEHPEAPELANLSLLARQLLLVIALKTNPTNPEKMRLSNAHLAYLTGATENAVQRATKALIECGAVSGKRERPRAATIYTLLLECPPDCSRKRNHYTPLELKERRSMTQSESVLEPSKEVIESVISEGLSPLKVVTNKQLTNKQINKLNKQTVEFAERKRNSDFSLGEFVKLLDEYDYPAGADLEAFSAITNNPERAYEIALLRIEQTRAKKPVNRPNGLIKAILWNNPRSLLGGLPGTKPRNPDFIAPEPERELERRDYLDDVWHLCAYLDIDYDEALATSTMENPDNPGKKIPVERVLRKHWAAGTLSPEIVARIYNQVCDPDEKTLWAPMSAYDRNAIY